jgi:hypothetical protein
MLKILGLPLLLQFLELSIKQWFLKYNISKWNYNYRLNTSLSRGEPVGNPSNVIPTRHMWSLVWEGWTRKKRGTPAQNGISERMGKGRDPSEAACLWMTLSISHKSRSMTSCRNRGLFWLWTTNSALRRWKPVGNPSDIIPAVDLRKLGRRWLTKGREGVVLLLTAEGLRGTIYNKVHRVDLV